MSYKSEFASNNADLRTILDVVNGLPDKVKKCKVTVSVPEGGGSSTSYANATVTINGTEYAAEYGAEAKTVEVDPGTVITLYVTATGLASNSYINVDGSVVASGGAQTYEYTVTKDITVELNVLRVDSSPILYGTIDVTTSDTETDTETESTFTPTDGGGTTYKSKFADNNVDLQKMLDAVNALGAEAVLISFTIDGTTYQAEEGMTWGEWMNSEYCTTTIAVTTDNIMVDSRGWYLIPGIEVNPQAATDVIVSGTDYYFFNPNPDV